MRWIKFILVSLTIGVGAFLTTAILPELKVFQTTNIHLFKWLFTILVAAALYLYKEKSWIKGLSILAAIIIDIMLVICSIP